MFVVHKITFKEQELCPPYSERPVECIRRELRKVKILPSISIPYSTTRGVM